MSRANRLTKIRDLRSAKVDQMTNRAMEAQQTLSGAERHAQTMSARYETLCENEQRDVATLMEQTANIPDPASRLAAMNHIVLRVRNARVAAYREMAAAESDVVAAESAVERANRALGAARAQFDGVDRIVIKEGAKTAARHEDAQDEEVLETFAGLRTETAPWA